MKRPFVRTAATTELKRLRHTLAMEVAAVSSLGSNLDSVRKAAHLMRGRTGKIVVTGVGKSAFVGMKMAATLTSLGHMCIFLHPVDALHGDSGIVSDGDVVIALSASGESVEVVKIARYLKNSFDIRLVAITKGEASALSKLSDQVITFTMKDEGSPAGLAPMASATATLVAGDLLAAAIVEPETFHAQHFAKLHPGGDLGLRLKKVSDAYTKTAMPLVRDSATLQSAIEMITSGRKGITGVTDKRGVLVGVITDGDVRRFVSERESIAGARAKDAMTRNPKTILPEASLKDALALMESRKITALFVVTKAGKPEGLLHMHDIVESLI